MTDHTHCETCGTIIIEGDMVTRDAISMIVFCAPCSPTWADMLANHDSYANGTDKYGEPIYLTADEANAMSETHIRTGGSLTDKFGLEPW